MRKQFQLMAEYNQWMNDKLYGVCAEMSEEERRRDLGAFFRSLHGTLNHLMYGDLAWMARFKGRTSKVSDPAEELYASFTELRAARRELDQEIIEWVETLTSDRLREEMEYTSSIDGKTRIIPAWCLVTHMFNHQTHHRGQLTTLIKQLGYEPGVTDIPWLPRFEGA
jgi:uncharacterized damage-inducible protein DinB